MFLPSAFLIARWWLHLSPRHPRLKALVIAAALFCVNVGVIEVGACLLGASADWMAAAEVAAPMACVVLIADLLVLPAVLVYFALHRSVSVAGTE